MILKLSAVIHLVFVKAGFRIRIRPDPGVFAGSGSGILQKPGSGILKSLDPDPEFSNDLDPDPDPDPYFEMSGSR